MDKNGLEYVDPDYVVKVTLGLRMLENSLSAPCLLKEEVGIVQTCLRGKGKYKLL